MEDADPGRRDRGWTTDESESALNSLSPLHVSHQSRKLDNGLHVVVHEDHSAPIVAVHLMYHVGSRDERPGRTGLAHLLEHLLFEGSEHCPKGEFDRLLERAGGTSNGSTWLDRTNYYEVVPSHAVELALWLERERMAHFLPVLDSEKLELQRGVVMNERRQTCENRPYGMADERLNELVFPAGHPYSWPTIGYMDDLEAITLDDARDFFALHCTPANAVLVLAGDIVPDHAFRLADRFFGDLPGGPSAPRAISIPGRITAPLSDRSTLLEDRVTLERVYRGFEVPPYGSPDWAVLDVLSYVLADGESARLQRRMVREQPLVLDVESYLYPTELSGMFGVVATARSGVEAGEVAAAIEEVLAEIASRGIDEGELDGAIRRARRDQLSALANMEDRAEELAYATTVLGTPEALDTVLESYVHIGIDDIRDAARSYLHADAGASVIVVPGATIGAEAA